MNLVELIAWLLSGILSGLGFVLDSLTGALIPGFDLNLQGALEDYSICATRTLRLWRQAHLQARQRKGVDQELRRGQRVGGECSGNDWRVRGSFRRIYAI